MHYYKRNPYSKIFGDIPGGTMEFIPITEGLRQPRFFALTYRPSGFIFGFVGFKNILQKTSPIE